MKSGGEQRNLLDLKPVRNVQWEQGEIDTVILLVPKFRNKLVRKWILPHLRRPNFRLKLDKFGSFVWNKCDGTSTVQAIADSMGESFGKEFDPKCSRIGRFVGQLARNEFVILKE